MKKIILISLFTIIGLFSIAQNTIPVKKSIIEIDVEKKSKGIKSIVIGDYIYSLFSKGRRSNIKYTIYKYDEKMTLLESKELAFDTKSYSFKDFLNINKKLYILAKKNDKKADEINFDLQEINLSSLQIEKNNILITEEYSSKKEIINPTLKQSKDEESIIVYYKDEIAEKDNMTISFKVFDKNLNSLWQKKIETNLQEKKASLYDVEIDDLGNLYFLIKYESEENKRVNLIKLYSVTDNGSKVVSKEISLGDDFITDCKLVVSKNKKLILTGFYSERDRGENIKGAFFSKYDSDKQELSSINKKEIAIELAKKDEKTKTKKKIDEKVNKGKNIELQRYNFSDLVMREDGGCVLIAEEQYQYTTSSTDSKGNVRYSTVYVRGDIIITSVSPEGKIDWINKIKKSQSSSGGSAFLSYGMVVYKNNIYIIYNDNIENHDISKAKEGKVYPSMVSKKKSVVTIYQINYEGYKKKEILFHESELGKNYYFVPSRKDQIADNKAIFYIIGLLKKDKALILEFE